MIKIYDVETARETILRRGAEDISKANSAFLERIERIFGVGVTPPQVVSRILEGVRVEGDNALRHWSNILDKVEVVDFKIPVEILEEAYKSMPSSLCRAMEDAAKRIRAFHSLQPLPNWETDSLGGRLGQRVLPINRVGIYVPGGTAPLPSSLLMSAIPAQVAGVRKIIICTPPRPHPTILAAAYLCGLEQVYQVGGAQAIAAMAYGTESIQKVNKIVGAGNLFVTLAKQQVYGIVGLDGLAGPTETVIIADGSANPAWIAADLLAQAEHDILASAILLTTDSKLAFDVQAEIEQQLLSLSRSEIIIQALEHRGGIILTDDMDTAVSLANDYAPEHLCLSVAAPEELGKKVTNAGGLFIGEYSFEVLGDYVAGPSHVMPTGGTAGFASPLNVLDFVKITSLIALDKETSCSLSRTARQIAESEMLTAHAAAAAERELD
jgi:histidinol dehydrogenase